MNRSRSHAAFSLVEVVIALGVMSFALLTMLSLLPAGIQSNRVSAEETRATGILTALEADLRNSYPSGNSLLFGLSLPYLVSGGKVAWNGALQANTLYTIALDDAENPVAISTLPSPPYQVSVIFTRLPAAGSLAPVEARLLINWPARNTSQVADLVDRTKVSGFVETYVAFPAP